MAEPDKQRAAGQARAARAKARRAAHTGPPQHTGVLEHLSLAGLRTYRATLITEADRVSYWRRLLQGRIDTLHTGAAPGNLRPALTDSEVLRGRSALVRIVPHSDLPALPELQELWEHTTAPGDQADRQAYERDLRQAETTLSAYRMALHGQLQTTTDELVARYHDDPSSCLSALPLPSQPAGAGKPPRG